MSTPTTTSPSHRSRNHSTNPFRKAALIAGGSIALGGVIAIFAGEAWLESYLQSTEFRQRVEAGLGGHLHADIQIAPFKRQGISVFSDSLDSAGREGAVFKQLNLRSLRADLNLGALWRRAWRVDFMNVQQLDLNLDVPTISPASAAVAPLAPKPSGWLASFLPNHTEIGTLKAEKSTVQKGQVQAQQVRLTASQNKQDWDILAEGGEIQIPGLPTLEISNAKMVLHQKALVLRNSRFLFKKGGETTVTGELSDTTGVALDAHLENVNIDPFLSNWWQTRIKGNIQGDLRYKLPAGNPNGSELEGTIQLKGGKLEALPILSHIDTFLGNPRFRSVPLKTASAHILITKERAIIRDLDLDGDGLMRITGNIVIEGTKLQGVIQLGVSPSLIQWLPGTQTKIFTDKRDGYAWTSIQLSGTTNNPMEDLSEKLLLISKDAVINTIKSVVPAGLPTPDPAKVPEAAKGVLDTLKGVIPGR